MKWNVNWTTKLNHFNLTLSRQFVHCLNELCCNTELGVIRIALKIAYFDIFLIIKNIFKCGMITQRFWEILCQTFLLIIFSQIISKWWSTWIDREHLPLSTQIVNSLSVAKTHWWQFYTFIMFYRNNQYLLSSIHFEINFLLFRYWFY